MRSAAGLGALVIIAAGAPLWGGTGANAQAPSAVAPTGAASLAGQWRFNADQSVDAEAMAVAAGTPLGGGVAGPGGYGRGGGMGGGGGTFGGGFRGSGISSKETLELRAMLREANQPPELLNIVVGPQVISFTNHEGVVRKVTANGKKEKVDLTTADVDSTTRWEQGTLVQDMKVGSVKVRRTWHVAPETRQLIVGVTVDYGNRNAQPTVAKFVFDRVPMGSHLVS
jgi:hypothetical protein